ncbi:MAG: alkaline phosphatase family protein, partial [Candidatus Sedimenticola endophacoides]
TVGVVTAVALASRFWGLGCPKIFHEVATLLPRALCGREPLSESLAMPSLAVMPEWIADSDFKRAFQGPARLARYRDMETFFDCCAAGLRGGGRHYVYAYWPEFDALAHEFGVASPQVAEYLARLEAGLERLQRRIAGSDTLVLVTADHGMIDSPTERTILLRQHPELADSLVLPLCGEPRFAYAYLRSGREQAFREYITGELAHAIDLHPSGRLLELGWFGSGPPHPRRTSASATMRWCGATTTRSRISSWVNIRTCTSGCTAVSRRRRCTCR